jgi:magnesium transporter
MPVVFAVRHVPVAGAKHSAIAITWHLVKVIGAIDFVRLLRNLLRRALCGSVARGTRRVNAMARPRPADEFPRGLDAGEIDFARALAQAQHPADVAAFIGSLDTDQAWSVLERVPLRRRAEIFGYLEPARQVDFARYLTRAQLAEIVAEMQADERADLFNHLAPEQQEALLPALAQAEREDIRRLASYPEGTAGAIMTSDYAALGPELSAREALERLRLEAPDKETVLRAYVIDPERKLIGSLPLQTLILAPPTARIDEIMERQTFAVRVDEDQEVARKIAQYDVLALPVVDQDGRLVGIVTYDDAFDVAEEEATEDFHKSATVGKIAVRLRDASVALLYRKRVAWLLLLVFANIFSGAGIAYYEETITTYVALVFFLPLLVDSSGNAGSQSATLIVRALATRDLMLRDWALMLRRELAVAAALGLTMAAAAWAIGLVRGGPEVAMVVAVAMIAVVITGSILGMLMPFVLSRLRLDPATASAPLITSIADALGVVIYLGLATAMLELGAR